MFLVINATFALYNPSRFRKNLLERIKKLITTNDDNIIDEKLKYDINREAAKLSTLSSGKINKYEYLTGEEVRPFSRKHQIKQAKFAYSPVGKALKKQTEKQVRALKFLELSNQKYELKEIQGISPKSMLNDLIINHLKDIIKLQDITKRMIYIIIQNAEKVIVLLNIFCFLFSKRYT